MARTSGNQIAEFFTKLGFKIDRAELNRYDDALQKLKKVALDYKRVVDSTKKGTFTKTQIDTLRIQKEQTKLAKEQLKLKEAQDKVEQRSNRAKQKAVSPRSGLNRDMRGFLGNSETVIRLRQDLDQYSKRMAKSFGKDSFLTHNRQAVDKVLSDNLRRLTAQFKRGTIALDEYKEGMVRWKRQARQQIATTKDLIKMNERQSLAMRRIGQSFEQYAGGFVSVFAAVAVTQDIFRKAKELEGMEAAMLGASGSATLAADRLKFLREESERTGISFLGTARSFSQLAFAAKGKMKEEDLRALFTGAAQFGTTMKVDQEQMKRGFNALNQMLNKNQIMA